MLQSDRSTDHSGFWLEDMATFPRTRAPKPEEAEEEPAERLRYPRSTDGLHPDSSDVYMTAVYTTDYY